MVEVTLVANFIYPSSLAEISLTTAANDTNIENVRLLYAASGISYKENSLAVLFTVGLSSSSTTTIDATFGFSSDKSHVSITKFNIKIASLPPSISPVSLIRTA
ncbi:unnamed protein product [Protopolystoma xenopodis]|uniref:Uncharacterized protein n=1 Tax=Protopolystoma xenopodis TaxID=117903 RepID=A0A3S5B2Q6_9PLAT|nr:unnamed protein product [Protopolystoma xenopodis]